MAFLQKGALEQTQTQTRVDQTNQQLPNEKAEWISFLKSLNAGRWKRTGQIRPIRLGQMWVVSSSERFRLLKQDNPKTSSHTGQDYSIGSIVLVGEPTYFMMRECACVCV